MKSLTLLFPGQGSQYVGMTKNHEATFKLADQILDYPLSKIATSGPEEELKLTQNTQPAIVAQSVSYYEWLHHNHGDKYTIDCVLGHSVGEYSALVVGGVLSFEDAIMGVHLRGKFMQEAVPQGIGAMVAVLRVGPEIIIEGCLAVSDEEYQVMPANFNEPKQTVISGHKIACDRFEAWMKENCKERFACMPLAVSAPFHSSLMKPAEIKLAQHFEKVYFDPSDVPYIANVNCENYPAKTSGEIIKQNLIKQVCGSVKWSESIQKLSKDSVFVEVGPSKVLSGLVKKIHPEALIFTMDDPESRKKLEEFLREDYL
jgi:[acyl-carrier-protein] S-malonyltransferase